MLYNKSKSSSELLYELSGSSDIVASVVLLFVLLLSVPPLSPSPGSDSKRIYAELTLAERLLAYTVK